MRFNLIEDFINVMSKAVYYINDEEGYSYQVRPLIYDAKFKIEEETTQAIAWISFPDLKPTFFVKEALFSLASAAGKPKHLDSATINKTRPNCTRVKVQVNLLADLPEYVEVEIITSQTKESRVEQVKIKYDYLPKYCGECSLQGHNKQECRILHPELRQELPEKEENKGKPTNGEMEATPTNKQEQPYDCHRHRQRHQRNPTRRRFINKGYL